MDAIHYRWSEKWPWQGIYVFDVARESVIFSISGRISTLILHNVRNAMWLVVHIHIQRNKGHHKRRTKYYNEEPATFVSIWHLHVYDLWLSTFVQWFICVTLYAVVKFSATCWYTFFSLPAVIVTSSQMKPFTLIINPLVNLHWCCEKWWICQMHWNWK